MLFLGIDFGWQGKPSGLASLSWNGKSLLLRSIERLTGVDEVLAWVDEQVEGGPAMIGVDAPIVIPNAAGMRDSDKLMHRHFGKYHAGCYPANLGRPFAGRTLGLSRALEVRGFQHGDTLQPRTSGRYQIEVHPHAACVQLFDLPKILKYKKGPVADRRRELMRYRGLLLNRLPRLGNIQLPEIPPRGSALKPVEDQLDAVLCAYIGAHWWLYGLARSTVYGSAAGGYIVVPCRVSSTLTVTA
jgi:predicted RNase H-like nuclease